MAKTAAKGNRKRVTRSTNQRAKEKQVKLTPEQQAEAELNAAALRYASLKTRAAVQQIVSQEVQLAMGKRNVQTVVHRAALAEADALKQIPNMSPSSPKGGEKESHKVCRICDTEQELEEFTKDKAQKDGLSTVCKTCAKAYREERRKVREKQNKQRKRKSRK